MNGKVTTDLELDLDKDAFLRQLLRELSGTLEDVVGIEEAAGFISIVGQHVADWIDREYRDALGADKLDFEQVCDVLVDLKRRIDGGFYIISADREKIVLGNTRCPFGDKVKDRTSLCMMTSNVFGAITAENLGYAKVSLEETIASGYDGCRVVVYLKTGSESDSAEGREYYKST